MTFRGKAVLVTGATSGIGAAIARAFGRTGADVLLSGRDPGRAEPVVADISAGGGRGVFVAADLAEADAGQQLVDATLDAFGRLDVLVNNAGIIHRATAEATTDAMWRGLMAVNLDAPFRLSRAVVPVMRKQGAGAIVNVASDWALVGGREAVAYCASKGALLQMTRAMALDHAREGIRVNAVCPTDVLTPMLEAEIAALGEGREQALARLGETIPAGRVGTPEDVAQAVLYLASDAAGFLTGVALPVDGGATAA